MACGKCPNCGSQMEEISVYGAKACQCSDCGYKTKPIKDQKAGINLNYSNSPRDQKE